MLSLKQTRKVKKGESLSPKHFDLLFNGGVAGGKRISANVLHKALLAGCEQGKKNHDTAMAQTKNVSGITEQFFKLHSKSKYMESFVLYNDDGQFSVKEPDCLIRYNYLEDDDNAPDRLFHIINGYCSAINQYFNEKAEETYKQKEDEYTTTYRARWTIDGDTNGLVFVNPDGTFAEVESTMLNKEEVKEAMYVYQVEFNNKVGQRNQEIMSQVTTVTKGLLKGLKIGMEEGRIVPLNLNQFNEETQGTIAEIMCFFQMK